MFEKTDVPVEDSAALLGCTHRRRQVPGVAFTEPQQHGGLLLLHLLLPPPPALPKPECERNLIFLQVKNCLPKSDHLLLPAIFWSAPLPKPQSYHRLLEVPLLGEKIGKLRLSQLGQQRSALHLVLHLVHTRYNK